MLSIQLSRDLLSFSGSPILLTVCWEIVNTFRYQRFLCYVLLAVHIYSILLLNGVFNSEQDKRVRSERVETLPRCFPLYRVDGTRRI